jgi:hypothetical protein
MRAAPWRRALAGLLGLGLAACPQEKAGPPPQATPPAAPSPPTAATAEPSPGALHAHPVPPGVVALDEDKLKRFIAYQSQLTGLSGDFAQKTQALERQFDAGFEHDSHAMSAALSLVQQQASARSRAAKELQLTDAEIASVERMISDILGRRLAQVVNQDALVEQLEDVMARVPADQRPEFERALKQARAARDESKTLLKQRARYGDANVDLVLAHEEELRKHWMAVAAGMAGAPAP